MKQILLIAFSLSMLAMVGCKKNVTPIDPAPNGESSEAMIYLGISGPDTRAGNAGMRDTIFQTGDQIGVIAAYSTTVTPETPLNAADWTKPVYFDNAAACFVKNAIAPVQDASGIQYDDNRSYFGWGPKAEGSLKWNKYYPSQDRPIMVYAYYPYADTSSITYVAPNGTTSKPQLKVKLNIDTIRLGAANKGANIHQSDILSYASAKEVKRTDTLKVMTFKHALAQLNFRFKRYKGSAIAYVDTIVFHTAREANMDVTTGAFTYTSTPLNDTAAKYVIIPEASKREVPVVEQKANPRDETGLLDIFNGATVNASPLMVLPLSVADLKKSTLRVVINTSADGEDRQSMSINLANLTAGFTAGKKNTFDILVTQSGINLEAKIEPWDKNGTVSDLETAD